MNLGFDPVEGNYSEKLWTYSGKAKGSIMIACDCPLILVAWLGRWLEKALAPCILQAGQVAENFGVHVCLETALLVRD